MCFSAQASFTASAVLFTIGTISIIRSQSSSQRVLASMPLVFALQQFTEGMVWLALMHPEYAEWKKPAMYSFVVFAQVVWPFFLPLSSIVLEKNIFRKKILSILLTLGACMSLMIIYGLINHPINARIDGMHIRYNVDFPQKGRIFSSLIYFITTIVSTFISSIKRMWMLGTALLISYIFTAIFFEHHVISVWCFFAALLSVVVVYIVSGINKPQIKRIYETSN